MSNINRINTTRFPKDENTGKPSPGPLSPLKHSLLANNPGDPTAPKDYLTAAAPSSDEKQFLLQLPAICIDIIPDQIQQQHSYGQQKYRPGAASSPFLTTTVDNNPKLKELMEMQLSPLTPSPASGMYRCFICWETSNDLNELVKPCQCKNTNLKWAHRKCIDSWVDQNQKTKCDVCMADYQIEYSPIPLLEVLRENKSVVMSYLLQVCLPASLYTILYFMGSLKDISSVFIIGHITVLVFLYAMFGAHIYLGLNRYKRRIRSTQLSAIGTLNTTGNSNVSNVSVSMTETSPSKQKSQSGMNLTGTDRNFLTSV